MRPERFQRKQTSYMIQTILPSIMMVAISYGSLFIPPTEVSRAKSY